MIKQLKTCGDVEMGESIELCTCGLIRAVNRPCGYVRPDQAKSPRFTTEEKETDDSE